MVPRWKRLQIRAFILVRSDNPNPDLLQKQRDLVAKMLELLRIRSVHSVVWEGADAASVVLTAMIFIRAEAVALQWTPEGPRATVTDESSIG